jgi:hypothetical protein
MEKAKQKPIIDTNSEENWMYQLQMAGMEPQNKRRGRKSPKKASAVGLAVVEKKTASQQQKPAARLQSAPESTRRKSSSSVVESLPHPDVLKILGPVPTHHKKWQDHAPAPAPAPAPALTPAQIQARTNWQPNSMGTTNARLRRKIGYFVKKYVPPLIRAGLEVCHTAR